MVTQVFFKLCTNKRKQTSAKDSCTHKADEEVCRYTYIYIYIDFRMPPCSLSATRGHRAPIFTK